MHCVERVKNFIHSRTMFLNLSWFLAPFNWHIINIVTLGCNITAELLIKVSARSSQRTALWPPRRVEDPS